LTPQYPKNSEEIHFADLDGDSQNELIASFRHNNEIKTLILKKQNNHWHKAAEISNPEHDTISYRGAADVKGEGKKQLLLGLSSNENTPTLYGYSLENSTAKKIFHRSYHRFEILGSSKNNDASEKAKLAVWDKKDTDSYDIQVLHWNGLELEPVKDTSSYHYKSAVPHYVKKVKQKPNSPSNWYNLADALEKSGVYRDALVAVKVGMKQDANSAFKENFLELRNKLQSRLKH